jgi:carboxylesterase
LRLLARILREAGHDVETPLLPGHGAEADRLATMPWQTWLAALDDALAALRRRCATVVVGGLSMGAILALAVTLERARDVDALVLLAPALTLDGWAIPWRLRAAMSLPACLLPSQLALAERPPFGLKDERTRALVVDAFRNGPGGAAGMLTTPMGALASFAELVRHVTPALGSIRQPTLIMHPREDDVASLSNTHRLQHQLAGPVETHVLDDSYHLVTIDRQRRRVAATVRRFVAECAVVAKSEVQPRAQSSARLLTPTVPAAAPVVRYLM